MSSRGLLVLMIVLIHYHCGAIGECVVSVTQDGYQEVNLTQGSITVSCQVNALDCSGELKAYWFRYLSSKHEELCTKQCRPRFSSSTLSNAAILEITGLQMNDSGIYMCGIFYQESAKTGNGTTLVVKDRRKTMVTSECVTLIVFCMLLLVYSVAVFVVYAHRSKWKPCRFRMNKETHRQESNKNNRSRRLFQAIAQEYHKRYPWKSQKQNNARDDDDTIYQNT
ncbi:immunoglobulin superfamily member 6 [Pelodytes ibericus]